MVLYGLWVTMPGIILIAYARRGTFGKAKDLWWTAFMILLIAMVMREVYKYDQQEMLWNQINPIENPFFYIHFALSLAITTFIVSDLFLAAMSF